MVGEKQQSAFGSLPVRGGSSPVECSLLLVHAQVADPCRRYPLVHAGDTLVRLGRVAERLRAGGQQLCSGSVRLGGMAPGRFQPITGRGGPAPNGVPVSFPQLLKPRAEGVKPGIDLPPTARHGLRLAVHISQHA